MGGLKWHTIFSTLLLAIIGCSSPEEKAKNKALAEAEQNESKVDERVRAAIKMFREMAAENELNAKTEDSQEFRARCELSAAQYARRAIELETLQTEWKLKREKDESSSLWKRNDYRTLTMNADAAKKTYAVTKLQSEALEEEIQRQLRLNELTR